MKSTTQLMIVPYMDKKLAFHDKKMLILKGKNEDYGTVRVQTGEGGKTLLRGAIVNSKPRTSRMLLPIEMLKGIKEGDNLNDILVAEGFPEHTVVFEESYTPFYEGQDPAQNADGETKLINGKEYYFQAICVPVGEKDSRIAVGTTTRVAQGAAVPAGEA